MWRSILIVNIWFSYIFPASALSPYQSLFLRHKIEKELRAVYGFGYPKRDREEGEGLGLEYSISLMLNLLCIITVTFFWVGLFWVVPMCQISEYFCICIIKWILQSLHRAALCAADKRKWKMQKLKLDSISNLIVRLLLWMIRFESGGIWRICESHHSLQYWGERGLVHASGKSATNLQNSREYPIFLRRKQAVNILQGIPNISPKKTSYTYFSAGNTQYFS